MTKLPNDVVIYQGIDSETGTVFIIEWDVPIPDHKQPKESVRWQD